MKTNIMHKLNSPITAFLALAAFLWLGWYCYPSETGYTDAQRAAMRHLVASVGHKKPMTHENAVKMVYLYGGNERE